MIRVASVYAVTLGVSLVCCSIARGQALDFRVDGPTTVQEGEYVELTVMFPEGVKADVDFTPIEEAEFGVHPVVSEALVDGKLTASVVGRKCTFSARCMGERDLVVVATAFANFDGVPRLKSLKHRIHVTAKQGPKLPDPPPPPKQPPSDPDDLGPIVPLPGASLPQSDVDKIAAILDSVMDRLEAEEAATKAREAKQAEWLTRLEKVSAGLKDVDAKLARLGGEVPVSAPAYGAGQPAASGPAKAESRDVRYVATSASPAIVDARPGHWSVASARNEWNASKSEAIAHLRSEHPSKARQFEPLESLTLDQILTLHDDAHEGRTSATQAVVSSPVSVYTQPVVRYAQPASGCPGGVCPTSGSSRVYSRGFFGFRR